MDIDLNYNLEIGEDVNNILSKDFFVLQNLSASMISMVSEPLKISASTSIFVKAGSCQCEIGVDNYIIHAPCIVNIRKSQILQIRKVDNDFNASFMVMSQRFCDSLLILIQESNPFALTRLNPINIINKEEKDIYERFYERISELFTNSKDPYAYKAMLFALASFYYAYGYKLYLSENTIKTGKDRIEDKFVLLVQEHFKKNRNLDFYASKLQISTKHLSKKIKQTTGYTAIELIERFVMLEAKVLLKSSNLSIKEISNELNFTSQSLFGKFFKKHAGISPKEFRNS